MTPDGRQGSATGAGATPQRLASSAAMPSHPLHEPVLAWYADHARDLPWRGPDAWPWGVLVSEVMLQQTPVARVLPVWRRWIERWPAPADLAAAEPGEAVREWGRLGYPRRALRLHAAAVEIVARFDGDVPADVDSLRSLPGVGSYTASAVAAFAFGRRHAAARTRTRPRRRRCRSRRPAATAARRRPPARRRRTSPRSRRLPRAAAGPAEGSPTGPTPGRPPRARPPPGRPEPATARSTGATPEAPGPPASAAASPR